MTNEELTMAILKSAEAIKKNIQPNELLDYITNLQEENEFLKLNNPEMNMEHFRIIKENKRKIDNLRKENHRLKELCDKYEEEHKTAFKLWTMKMEEMPNYEERIGYKTRNEKAINILELSSQNKSMCTRPETDTIQSALNILKGGISKYECKRNV